MLVGVYKLKQNDVDNIDSHILTILPIKITINKSKEPNINNGGCNLGESFANFMVIILSRGILQRMQRDIQDGCGGVENIDYSFNSF